MKVESETGDLGICLELKYCERCGGLWLRLKNESGVHCGSCREHFAKLPKRGEGGSGKSRRVKAVDREQMCAARIEYLAGVEEREERV